MTELPEKRTFEEDLAILLKKSHESSEMTMGEIVQVLHGKGRFLLLIFLSLPFCQPIQIPGVSIPFGIVIAFIGLRIAFGKQIWLPKKILRKKISSKKLRTLSEKGLKVIKKMKKVVHPRLLMLCQHPLMQIFNGLLIFFSGFFLALPFPIPFSNLIAAWSIFLMSLGLLEDDGLFVFFGYFVCFIAILVTLILLLSLKGLLKYPF